MALTVAVAMRRRLAPGECTMVIPAAIAQLARSFTNHGHRHGARRPDSHLRTVLDLLSTCSPARPSLSVPSDSYAVGFMIRGSVTASPGVRRRAARTHNQHPEQAVTH